MDLVETCAQERANKKLRYALTTNVTIFSALLNKISMGCLDAVIPEQLLSRSDINFLVTNGYGETEKDYLCLFRDVAVHLYGSAELETNAAKLLSDFHHKSGHDAINFRGVSMDHIVFVENAIKHNIFIYDIVFEDRDLIGELARRSFEMYEQALIYCAATTTFAMLMMSTHSSTDSAVLTVILLLRVLVISTVTWNLVKIGYSTFIRRVFTPWEKLCLINLTDLELELRKIENCSKNCLYLISNPSAFHLMN